MERLDLVVVRVREHVLGRRARGELEVVQVSAVMLVRVLWREGELMPSLNLSLNLVSSSISKRTRILQVSANEASIQTVRQ
jgi:hypothetical protein